MGVHHANPAPRRGPGSERQCADDPDRLHYAANPIPAEAQCKVDQVDRRGSLVTWAMTCNSPRGEIHSAGSARYAGNTMEGTVTARSPGPDGQPVDTPVHIAGRYLAPCEAK